MLLNIHTARHGFATLALSKGVPIESVSRVLEHTNITTTQKYAKITTEKIDKDLTMFGVIAPTLRAAIKAIYKSRTLCPVSSQHCDLAMPQSWATFYNLEVAIALAFRLNTYEASWIREKVLEGFSQRKESEINILLSLGNIGHQISPKGLY